MRWRSVPHGSAGVRVGNVIIFYLILDPSLRKHLVVVNRSDMINRSIGIGDLLSLFVLGFNL